MQRRLAAILALDVVGYSRLMGVDEAATLDDLRRHRRELIDPAIAAGEGRIVKATGDGLLVAFASSVAATQAALAIQRGMAARTAADPAERRMQLRAGIHVGDVVVEADDLFGDVVNIAARLESIAAPGGICLSDDVWRQVRGRVEAPFEDRGPIALKNIARPVHVHALAGSEPFVAPSTGPPAIAVLPFANLSGDPARGYLADGITEDILVELGRFRSLFVVARNSSFTYREADPPVGRVGAELGARYVLSGSVRWQEPRLRITAALADAADGRQIWAERYDRAAEDIFAVQDDVVATIAATLVGRLEASATHAARRRPTTSLAAWDLVLQAKELRHRHTPDDEAAAQRLLEQALALDPTYGHARAQLALTHLQQFFWDDTGRSPLLAIEIAEAALANDERDPWAHMVLGLAFVHLRRWDEALRHSETALALNPCDPALCAKHGLLLADLGRHAEGIACIERAQRLDPFGRDAYATSYALALFGARRYREAIAALDQAPRPKFYHHIWRAAAYAHLGELARARAHAAEGLRLAPDLTIARFARLEPIRDPADLEHWVTGFRLAGIPE
ncbi:MAG: adenylate/guanylate cyclase domain-containing protein [Geminicoccaceae bacterium]